LSWCDVWILVFKYKDGAYWFILLCFRRYL